MPGIKTSKLTSRWSGGGKKECIQLSGAYDHRGFVDREPLSHVSHGSRGANAKFHGAVRGFDPDKHVFLHSGGIHPAEAVLT